MVMKFKSILLLVLLTTATYSATGSCYASKPEAGSLEEALQHFEKIRVGPLVNVVLTEGEQEHIRIEYGGISPEKINFGVKGKTLSIYLDDAKYTVKTEEIYKDGYKQKVPIYRGVQITAYVTYKNLREMEIRGEEKLSCRDSLKAGKFKIRMFGESSVDLAYLDTDQLKVRLYGENSLGIGAGDSKVQKYRLFGENSIDSGGMAGSRIATSSFGENKLDLSANEQIRLLGFGDVKMQYSGDPQLRKFIIGESHIDKR